MFDKNIPQAKFQFLCAGIAMQRVWLSAIHFVTALFCCLAGFSLSANAQSKRVALVIGNDKYVNMRPLDNAAYDADSLGAILRENGWLVIKDTTNLSFRDFQQKLAEFETEGRDAEATLVYYSGHGLAIAGHNYLAPTDADVSSCDLTARVDKYMVAVEEVVQRALTSTNAPQGVVIIDACRNSPFPRCPKSKGASDVGVPFARELISPSGTIAKSLIAYSTSLGSTASDGNKGEHSPFAAAFLAHLEVEADVPVAQLLDEVRDDVISMESGQEPEVTFRGTPTFCVADGPCKNQAPSTKPSLIEAKKLIDQHYYDEAISKHLKPLAEKGNVEAIRQIVDLYQGELANTGKAEDWLRKEISAGDQSARIDLAWSLASRYPGDVDQDPNAATDAEALKSGIDLARELYNNGNQEAGLILYDNSTRDDSLVSKDEGQKVLQSLSEKAYAPALRVKADALLDTLQNNKDDPKDHDTSVKALQLYEAAAKQGEAAALQKLIEPSFNNWISENDLKIQISDQDLEQGVNIALAKPVRHTNQTDSWHLSAQETVDLPQYLVKWWIGNGHLTQDEVDKAISILDRTAEAAKSVFVCDEGGCRYDDLSDTVSLTRGLLFEASGRHAEAFDLLTSPAVIEASTEVDLKPALFAAIKSLAKLGWDESREKKISPVFRKACRYSLEERDGADSCGEVAINVISQKRSALAGLIYQLLSDDFKADEGNANTSPNPTKLYLVALLAEGSDSYRPASKDVATLFQEAAAAGSHEARNWLKSKNLQVPEQALRAERIDIGADEVFKNWDAYRQLLGDDLHGCGAYSKNSIVTPSPEGKTDGRFFGLAAAAPAWGAGSLTYDTHMNVVPGSVSARFDNDVMHDLKFDISPKGRITFVGDPAALFRQLSWGAIITISYKVSYNKNSEGGDAAAAKQRSIVDAYSLLGFNRAYDAMIKSCSQMKRILSSKEIKQVGSQYVSTTK